MGLIVSDYSGIIAPGKLIQTPYFLYHIMIEKVYEDKAKGYKRDPDGFSQEKAAEKSRSYASQDKGNQHNCVSPQPFQMGRPFLGMTY